MDDSILLGHDGAPRGNWFPTFRRNILSLFSRLSKSVTQRSIPEVGNPQAHRCENVKICAEEEFENVNSKTVE